MKFSHQLMIGSLAVLALSACSSNPADRRQAKDDFTYLETPALQAWKSAQGADNQFYPNFEIPQGDFAGGIGQDVDIRPPQQVLELIPGARLERNNGEVTLWLARQDDANRVWQTALDMVKDRNIKTRTSTSDRVETEWVIWLSEDEDTEIGSRYQLSRFEANNRYGFRVSLIDWREGDKVLPVSQTDRERYNAFMTNLVTAKYDSNLRAEAQRRAQELVKQIPVSMGTDRSGLPVIIARAQYNVLWERLPRVLPQIGFDLEERNQSQGRVEAKYKSPDDEFWESIGVKPIDLKSGKYTFQLGDLGNRTSINVTDSKGKPVEEELLKSLVPVLAAIAKQD